MKKIFLFTLSLLLATATFAQTQRGYVKTKGRMVNGQLVPGQGLKGATVSVQGRTTVIVNNEDGEFSFPVSNQQFKLDSVRKKGYQLVDLDACPRTYNYSDNPIYIVMETPDQQLQDQLMAERKIRRNLQKQLQDKEDEIEELKAQHKISDDEYRKALQKLYQDQENNEQLIKDMAKRYSELDYDQLDEFYRQVSYCIENGELTKADSLLNNKGNVVQQIEEEKQIGLAIQEQKRRIKKAEAIHAANIDELAKRCYSYYENFKAQHQNDTAAYYLELRASLDTTNVEWQNDAGNFFNIYIADYEKAMRYAQITLRNTILQGDNQSEEAEGYSNIGIVYFHQGAYDKALECFEKSLIIRKDIFPENHPDIASNYSNIGVVCSKQGNNEKALEYHKKSLVIRKNILPENHPDIAMSYECIGCNYILKGDCEKGLEYLNKALNIQKIIFGENHPDVALSYDNIGNAYKNQGDYTNALENYQNCYEIRNTVLGKDDPQTINVKEKIEEVQQKLQESEKTIK